MKKYYLGIDLGSTTSKAVIIDEQDNIIGRGITNTRSNYEVAAEIAKQSAIYNARFYLLQNRLSDIIERHPEYRRYIKEMEDAFQYLQFSNRLEWLRRQLLQTAGETAKSEASHHTMLAEVERITGEIQEEVKVDYLERDLGSKSQFFRDIVGEKYNEKVSCLSKELFEPMMLLFDKSINPVENEMISFQFKHLVEESMALLNAKYANLADVGNADESVHFDAELNLLKGNYQRVSDSLKEHINYVSEEEFHIAGMVGTGYGRALLPFPENCIKSEILCHAFGAHAVFPNTRTVLDIGGQDTKAIQVDQYGLVTSFHMNDRCAAGCGRYLGYIADELNISLNELGPLALEAQKEVTICSTCTVFAGAELRELLNVGEKREDILAGLHRAIVMRAMSLLARSGGVRNEFTFTGGVARNHAVLKYVSELVRTNYGQDLTINVHTDSIFMGALGGAMFARRNIEVALPEKKKKEELEEVG
ncbi:MAG: benzoyl-CoA reductase subunit A [Bacteroidetes bacterium]|nr:benzoyl-CoA reductase subunit A [Bacteroidota bacterium]